MKPFVLSLAVVLSGIALSTALAAGAPPPRSAAFAFVDVNVVPMDSNRIIERQTVIVRDGKIAELGAVGKITIPKQAQRVIGSGRYLMPGLIDMHVHLKSPHEFPLYLANGVTTVYNLWGWPANLAWRQQIARGKILGPTIYTCGPIIFRADTPGQARQIVEAQCRAGYDSIKIYNDVSREAYPALVEAARRNHMLVVGHIPREPGLEGALAAHQAIAHLEEYIYTFFKDNVEDESRIPEAVAATRAAGVPVILTLVNFDHIIRQAEDLPAFLARPETKYLAPWVAESWQPAHNFYYPRFHPPESQQYMRKALAFQKTLTRELHRAGVRLLVGTDAMNPGVVPGFSVLEELSNLAEIGFTPFEALQSATRYPAEFLCPGADFGTVAVGKRADLILLENNPLQALTNVTSRVGVMIRGHWLPEKALQTMLAEIPHAYAREKQFAKSQLESHPRKALRFLSDNDPFNNLALQLATDMIVENGFIRFKNLFDTLKPSDPGAPMRQEWFINEVGLRLLQTDKTKEAIDLFRLNTETYPQSANTYDSLAEAHLKNGDRELAIGFYRKALAIDPGFTSALEALKRLSR